MNLSKLNPWNWFKHEDEREGTVTVPVRRDEYPPQPSAYGTSAMHPILQLQRELERWFDEAFRGFGNRSFGVPRLGHSSPWPVIGSVDAFNPQLNVASDDEEYVITLEAPGMDEKDLQIELQERRLLISGNKQEESENRERHFYRIERRYGSFQRVLALPDDAKAENIAASMKQGVLTIRIPRTDSGDGRRQRIAIQAA